MCCPLARAIVAMCVPVRDSIAVAAADAAAAALILINLSLGYIHLNSSINVAHRA